MVIQKGRRSLHFFFLKKEERKMSLLSLRIVPEKEIRVTIGTLPKSIGGEKQWEKYMITLFVEALLKFENRSLLLQSTGLPIVLITNSGMEEKKKNRLQQIIRCGLLVLRNEEVRKKDTLIDENLINFNVTSNSIWKDVPVYMCYYNPEEHLLADPEFLLLFWSTNLENFDPQQMALLPSLPRNPMSNSLLSPLKVREVLEQIVLEWQITGRRFNKTVIPTREKALQCLSEATPLLYRLVYDEDGSRIFQCAYDIQVYLDRLSPESWETQKNYCQTRYEEMFRQLRDKGLKAHLLKHNRLAVESAGMSHPMIKSGCLLTNYATYLFLYFPPRPRPEKMEDPGQNIFSFDNQLLNAIDRIVAQSNRQRETLYQLDYDPKTQTLVLKAIPSLYHSKERMQIICRRQWFTFLEASQSILFCNKSITE
jgi:hypothetical protein